MKIRIEKSQEAINKELEKVKLVELKAKKNITNDELKELILMVLDRLEV